MKKFFLCGESYVPTDETYIPADETYVPTDETYVPSNGTNFSLSFPDFSRRFFASLAEKIYTFSLAILLRFTVSLIPCCEC
ncbi:MAG: hypothetical protein IKZ00_06005, partial [Bacteroidaceae bacterium]|nr:hypothetical protein [Bacteroidaceae bacterium]